MIHDPALGDSAMAGAISLRSRRPSECGATLTRRTTHYRNSFYEEDIPMYRTTILSSLGRRAVAAGLAAVALSTTACRDATTAPTVPTASETSGPNAISIGSDFPQVATFISVKIIDVTGIKVTEKAMVRFRWSQPKDSVFVTDNSAKDLDPTIGVVKIAVPKAAGYDACVRGTTARFVADSTGPSYPTCNSKFWLSYNINLGNVYMRRKPTLSVKMIDTWSNLLPGATLRVYNQSGFSLDVADGQAPWDQPSVNDGKITVVLPKAADYVWGPIKNPTGKYAFIDSWYIASIKWEENHQAQLLFEQVPF
jgi:hypothetical protein